jgi:RNA polymerase sigma-70 factor, ECF subfamily
VGASHGRFSLFRDDFMQLEVDRKRRFTEQLQACHRQLFAYIFALLRNMDEAQDVFQETAMLLWEKFDEFTPGTNFCAWACTIAQYKVRNFVKARRRNVTFLSGLFAEKLAAIQASVSPEQIDARRAALGLCVEKLTSQQRELLGRRYGANVRVSELADELGRPPRSVHNSLRRIREVLLDCIDRTMAQGSSFMETRL